MAINSLNAASKGFSGLVSGIDTESVVNKLLSGTQSKIDKAGQKKTVLQYKQTMYRDVIAKIKSLQSSFLSYTSKTNLLSSTFFDNMTSKVTPPTGVTAGFSVTASSKAAAGNTTVDYIKQLATAFTQQSTSNATGTVSGSLDSMAAQKLLNDASGSLNITVGNDTVTFDDAALAFAGLSPSEVAAKMNEKLSSIGAEARFVNNKLTITSADSSAGITVQGNTAAMKMFGTSSTSISSMGTFAAAVDTSNYNPKLTINLDGRSQDIAVDLNKLKAFAEASTPAEKEAAGTQLAESMNQQIQKVFGTGVKLTATAAGGTTTLAFAAGSPTSKFTLTGSTAVTEALGIKNGVSNKISTAMAVKDLNTATALQGNNFNFNINGVEFSYSGDTSLSTIMNDINNSKAGVRISYVESTDRFVIQNTQTGSGYDNSITMSQTEGNLLTAMFGVAGGSNVSGSGIDKTLVGGALTSDDVESFAYGTVVSFNVNGKDYQFTVEKKANDEPYTAEEFAGKLNEMFKKQFGTMTDGSQGIEFQYDSGGNNFKITTNSTDYIVKAVKEDGKTNHSLMGFTEGDSTRVSSGATKISDAGISFGTSGSITVKVGDGTALSIDTSGFGANTTFDDVAAKIQDKLREATGSNATVTFDSSTAAFRILGVDIPMDMGVVEIGVANGADSENMQKLFGTQSLQINQPAQAGAMETVTEGRNAIVSINGVELERASNTFEYNGLTFTLQSESRTQEVDGKTVNLDGATTITSSRDTDTIVNAVTDFIKQYNELVTYLNDIYKAEATYKNYAPLSSEQKKEMSESEIKAWEEKAKEGLLRNDSNISRVMQSMRSALYSRPEGSGIAIYDLGISTSYFNGDGTLELKSEADLRAAIEADPEAIRKLFSSSDGIMNKLNTAINEATKASSGGSGYLTAIAGTSSFDSSSSIYKQIKEIDKQLTSLESRYWKQYDRYWKQFNSMEQMIQTMNTQSSWLSSQLG